MHAREVSSRAACCVAFGRRQSQNLLISGGFDAVIRVWNVVYEELLVELKRHKGKVQALSVSEDGSLVI